MSKNIKNNQKGIVQLIILVIVALIALKYFGLSLSEVIDWIKNFLDKILTFLK
ncbi:MAG: hypothetical protein AAB873_03115 [Patescibacteria group bacterium]